MRLSQEHIPIFRPLFSVEELHLILEMLAAVSCLNYIDLNKNLKWKCRHLEKQQQLTNKHHMVQKSPNIIKNNTVALSLSCCAPPISPPRPKKKGFKILSWKKSLSLPRNYLERKKWNDLHLGRSFQKLNIS